MDGNAIVCGIALKLLIFCWFEEPDSIILDSTKTGINANVERTYTCSRTETF